MRLDSVSYNPYSNRRSGERTGDVDQWMMQNIRVCSGDEYERYRDYLAPSVTGVDACAPGYTAYGDGNRNPKRQK